MIKLKKVKLLMFSLIVISMVLIPFSNIFAVTTTDKLNDVKKEQDKNKEEQNQVDEKINSTVNEIRELEKEVTKFNIELDDLQSKLKEVNDKIASNESDLQNAAQNFNTAQDMYQTRLRAIYENGIPSVVDIFFTSNGISDFFSKVNVYNSILDYDKNMIESMKNQKEYTDNLKNDIEVQKMQLEQVTYDMEKSTKALETAQSNKQYKMNELKKSQKDLKAVGEQLAKEEVALNKKIQQEIIEAQKKNQNNNNFNGQFYWPVPGFNVITTRFNSAYDPWGTGTSTIHTGADIAGSGINGTPVHAAESGKVIIAKRLTTGYGRYVVIDHGKSSVDGANYTTLYGHMTDFIVSEGQSVQRGQVIGYVGSTGNSTGSHLHLEFRKNSVRVNPLSYFSGMKFIYR